MNREVGIKGEQEASKYLQNRGYAILARNYRVRAGEIDIIATNNQEILFVEVKFRKTKIFGGAVNALSTTRVERLRNAALMYLGDNNITDRQVKLMLLAIQGAQISEIIID